MFVLKIVRDSATAIVQKQCNYNCLAAVKLQMFRSNATAMERGQKKVLTFPSGLLLVVPPGISAAADQGH